MYNLKLVEVVNNSYTQKQWPTILYNRLTIGLLAKMLCLHASVLTQPLLIDFSLVYYLSVSSTIHKVELNCFLAEVITLLNNMMTYSSFKYEKQMLCYSVFKPQK